MGDQSSERGREVPSGGEMLRGLKKAPKTSVVTDLGTEAQEAPAKGEPVAQTDPEPQVQTPPPPKPKPAKVTFYQDAEARARARSTFVATQAQTGYRSFSEFIATAVEKECARLEAAHNDGEQFRIAANLVKQGRPFRQDP